MKRHTALVLLFIFLVTPARASNLVTFQVTAVVDSVDDPLSIIDGSVIPGDTLTGLMQYDLDLTDNVPDPNYGQYSADPPGDNFINGTNAGLSFFETSMFMFIDIDNAPLGSDVLSFYVSGDTTPSLLAHPDVDYVDLDILLIDDEGTVLTDDGLPATLDLAEFETASLILSGDTYDPIGGGYYTPFAIYATITSISQVPEPSTLILAGLSLTVLNLRRKRLA